MTKRGEIIKSWKRRFFELDSNGILVYFEVNKERDSKICKGRLDMKECTEIHRTTACKWKLSEAPRGAKVDTMLELVLPGRTYAIFCDTVSDTDNWFLSLDIARAAGCFGYSDIRYPKHLDPHIFDVFLPFKDKMTKAKNNFEL